jgi:hypothetical protein
VLLATTPASIATAASIIIQATVIHSSSNARLTRSIRLLALPHLL